MPLSNSEGMPVQFLDRSSSTRTTRVPAASSELSWRRWRAASGGPSVSVITFEAAQVPEFTGVV